MYVPCLPNCPKCKEKLSLIRERLDDAQRGINTCFSNSRPWVGTHRYNDCLLNPKLCHKNAECEYKNKTYECSCEAGYQGI